MNFFKKWFALLAVIILQVTSVGQTLQFSFDSVYAASNVDEDFQDNSWWAKTDLVMIFVSKAVYPWIRGQLDWYTNTYIPSMAPGTTSLVMEIDPAWYDASDLQRILENLYLDWQQWTPSQLAWVIMFGQLPWPIVEIDNKRFVSLYPYLDFKDPMFVFDPIEDVFLFNDHPDSLPELRHSTIPTDDVWVITTFFGKLQEYFGSPTDYAEKKIWYDDFLDLKKAFTEEEEERYINNLLFSEAQSYRQVNPIFPTLLSRDYEEDLVQEIEKAEDIISTLEWQAFQHESVIGNSATEAAAQWIFGGLNTILWNIDKEALEEHALETWESPTPTKILERTLEWDFQPAYQVFWNDYLTRMQENISAWWRYAPEEIDTSLEKIEISDRVAKTFVKDMNDAMSDALEAKIRHEEYQLKFPLPFRLSVWDSFINDQCFDLFGTSPYDESSLEAYFERFTRDEIKEYFGWQTFTQWPFKWLTVSLDWTFITNDMDLNEWRWWYERQRYEMFYFWKNAVDIVNYEDVTIFRGTPYNQTSAKRLAEEPYQPTVKVEDLPGWSHNDASMWLSIWMFAQQTQNNKAFNFDRFLNERTLDKRHDYKFSDKLLYDELKRWDDLTMWGFAKTFFGWAAPTNIAIDEQKPRYVNMNYIYEWTDETYLDETDLWKNYINWLDLAWNPSVARWVWAPWYDPGGAVLTEITTDEDPVLEPIYKPEEIHGTAHEDYWRMIMLRSEKREWWFLRWLWKAFWAAWSAVKGKMIEESDEDKTERYDIQDLLEYDHPKASAIKYQLDDDDDDQDDWVKERPLLDKEWDARNSYEEMDYFWVYENVFPWRYPKSNWIWITVQPTLWAPEDNDTDWIPDVADWDRDGDWIPNEEDSDQDGDRIDVNNDIDIDGDWIRNGDDRDTDWDWTPNSSDDDIDWDGIINKDDLDVDNDFIPNIDDRDIDADWVENESDTDIDWDGEPNLTDLDMDGDGIPNGEDPDTDADTIPNQFDKSCGWCGWWCNWAKSDVDSDWQTNGEDDDIDGDWIPNQEDADMDGDWIKNEDDWDIDGDWQYNNEDADMDADRLLNTEDPDIDADGILNENDSTPTWRILIAEDWMQVQLMTENCIGQNTDIDDDGIPNKSDYDMDWDGIHNAADIDIDADGIPNGEDSDMDCDGKLNGEDDDIDADSIKNKSDGDCNWNWVPNWLDPDVDADGLPNWEDGDVDGDWQDNGADSDVDWDFQPNGEDWDVDGDWLDNGEDPDIDWDWVPNGEDDDADWDGIPNDRDPDQDGDWLENWEDPNSDWDEEDNDTDLDDDNDEIPDEIDETPLWYDINVALSKREDRGSVSCVLEWHDYRYQLVDTLVTHRAWDDWEIDPQTTMMTLERPIDDGRYVSFHGLWWDVVDMFYPDLYNVPIYNCDLKDPEDIESEIIDYLQQKVQYYNQLLVEQLDKAPSHYATHPQAFDFLETVEKVATPNREYELMDTNFFVDLLGEKNIRRLSWHLHYLSTWWSRRPEAATIWEFIENSRNEFDINQRLTYIYREYVKWDDPADEFKFDWIAYPTHISEDKAYEMWFINSSGSDAVKPQSYNELVGKPVNQISWKNWPDDTWNHGTPWAILADTAAAQKDAACWIPWWLAVPVLKRPNAFKCWLEKTLEDPIDFSLEIEYDFSETFGESYQNRLQDRWNKVWSLQDNMQQVAWFFGNVFADESNPTLIEYTNAKNINRKVRSELSAQDQKRFDVLAYETSLSIENNYYVGNEREGGLWLSARSDVWPVILRVEAIWELCPEVWWVNLCERTFESGFVRPFDSSFELPVVLDIEEVWVGRLLVEVCDTQNTEICHATNFPLVRGPWQLSTIDVYLPSETIVAWSPIPVGIQWADKLWNIVDLPWLYYDLVIEWWSLDGKSSSDRTTITDFSDAYYIVYPSWESELSVSLVPSDEEYRDTFPTAKQTISLVPATFSVSDSAWSKITWFDYRLPQKSDGFEYTDDVGIVQLNPDSLPIIQVSIQSDQWTELVAPITARSQQWIVRVWTVERQAVTFNQTQYEQTYLKDATWYISSWTEKTKLSILPTWRAWKDTIIVESPWFDDIIIPITIKPSWADNLEIDIDYWNYSVGDVVEWTMTITDSRWNAYTEIADVELTARWWLELETTEFVVEWWEAAFTWSIAEAWSCGCGWKCSWRNTSSEEQEEELPPIEEKRTEVDEIDPERWDDYLEAWWWGKTTLSGENRHCVRGSEWWWGWCGWWWGWWWWGGWGWWWGWWWENQEAWEKICFDGLDDDWDGYVDCNDLDCKEDQACVNQEGEWAWDWQGQWWEGAWWWWEGWWWWGWCWWWSCWSWRDWNWNWDVNWNSWWDTWSWDWNWDWWTDGWTTWWDWNGDWWTDSGNGWADGQTGDWWTDGSWDWWTDGQDWGSDWSDWDAWDWDTWSWDSDGWDWEEWEDNWWDDEEGEWWACGPAPERPQWPPEWWYWDWSSAYWESTWSAWGNIRQKETENDPNIMYLNLMWKNRWQRASITQMLANHKTLSITTFHNLWWSRSDRRIVASIIYPDWTVNDKKNIVKELVAEWGDIVYLLWYNAGIWRVRMGSYAEFDFIEEDWEYTDKPNKLVYSPVWDWSFEEGRIIHKDEVMVDFRKWIMDPDIFIRLPEWWWDQWIVTYKNKKIWTLWLWRWTPELERDISLYRSDYTIENRPWGNSTTSAEAVTILLDSEEDAWWWELFESIEASINPKNNVWFRHEFSSMTNFAQWMSVWNATKHFGWLFLMNIWDPFLKRIEENQKIMHTDYDWWVGQVVFSDATSFEDVDVMDYDNDWRDDLLITYKDGAMRLLKNYWWENPYKDMGNLIVIPDWIRETYLGDLNGDWRDDILIYTKADKLRAYMNNEWKIEVDWTPVCLDIPNWEFNAAQVRQLFATDLDWWGLDIVTLDTSWDLKVFFGWWWAEGPSYLSRNKFSCDEWWRERQNQQLVKSFGSQVASDPIRDYSLRSWAQLEPLGEVELELEWSFGWWGYWDIDFEDLSESELKEFSKNIMETAIDDAKSIWDPEELLEASKKKIDYVTEVPDSLLPNSMKWTTAYWIRANELYDDTPRFDVEKTFMDLNWWNLQKWDMVRVSVSIIPVGASNMIYWEKLDGPWIIYRDEYWGIPSLQWSYWWWEIDWNIGNWYEFMVHGMNWWATFSYEAQYDGDWYVHIDIETEEEWLFRWPTEQSVAWVQNVYAQWWWSKKIRAYADDWCYKKYREFSPGEEEVDLTDFVEEKTNEYEDYFNDQRDESEEILEHNTDLDPIEEMLWIPVKIANQSYVSWKDRVINSVLWWGWGWIEIDAESYNEYFEDLAEETIERLYNLPLRWLDLIGFDSLWMFEDYSYSKNKCGGTTFGKKSCGFGLPIPFNNDLLSPWDFHVFGCKPKAPQIPSFFPHFDGVPIFAFPTKIIPTVPPVWPPMPLGAWWIPPFAWSNSQIRAYATITTSWGVWLSLCFAPYDSVKLPELIRDVAWNCLVIAWSMPWWSCYWEGEDNNPALPTRITTENEKEGESTDILTQEHMDLYRTWVCDQRAQDASPIQSWVLGGPVFVPGKPKSVQMSQMTQRSSYLKWWETFDLKIEGWSVKWLAQCILRKWTENQSRYFANNALNMQIDVILPQIWALAENFEDIQDIDDDRIIYQYWFDNAETATNKTENVWSSSQNHDPQEKNTNKQPPLSIQEKVTNSMNNPFEFIASYFDNVPLINFEERDTGILLPFLYQEDIDRYEFHLESWVDRNEKILAEWWTLDVSTDALDQMNRAISQVQRNLETLKLYRELPNQIYELLHMTDQYVVEIIGFAQQFLWTVTWWLQNNANRFSAWVDFIIVLKWIIETWQLIIDFSVNWETKCAQCRQDNYDFYSCKLKFLCFDLPILPLPPFHLPNIKIDLSKIDIWIDVILPKFRFVPKKMTLPRLIDLPTPKSWIDFEVVVPQIPRLPRPPPLPDMPTLSIDLEMKLPTLPPAPRMPDISPAIQAVVKIADIIGTFVCIFKWWIGLVRENSIKTRVEQMTQRTQDLLPFDELQVTIPAGPVQWYDYKIDSLVDIKADFRQLYDIVDGFVGDWNFFVNKQVRSVKTSVANVYDTTAWFIDDVNVETDIDIDLSDTFGVTNDLSDEQLVAYIESKRSSLFVWWEVEDVRDSLEDGLNYIRSRDDLYALHDQADRIDTIIDTRPLVEPNYEWLEGVWNEIETYLLDQHKTIRDTKLLVRDDYDAFLDTLAVFDTVTDTTTERSFGTALFETDAVTKEMIAKQEHPLKTYLTLNKWIVDWYKEAITKNTPADLRMDTLRYNETRQYLYDLSDWIDTVLVDWFTPTVIAQNTPAPEKIIAQAWGWWWWEWVDPKLLPDFTQFMQWFFVPWEDDNYHNVITWKERWNEWYRSNTFEVADLNGDWSNEIINYTEHQIFVKYGKQNASFGWWISGSYTIGPYATIEQLVEWVKPTAWWYNAWWATFKIRDDYENTYSFQRAGQSFDTLSFGWKQDPHISWYLIEVAERVEVLQEKDRWGPEEEDKKRTRYILALPSSVTYENVDIEIYDQLRQDSVDDYLESGVIAKVLYYDATQVRVDALLEWFDRERFYTRISPLRIEKFTEWWWWFGDLLGKQDPEYVLRKIWPWSEQRLAWAQNWADEQRPWVWVELVRDLTWETVAQWQEVQWYINTTYTLKAKWDDNGEVLQNWIIYDGEVVKLESGDEIQLDALDYKYPIEEDFLFVSIDQSWNIGQQEVKLSIIVPEIEIQEIRYLGSGAEVVTKMSQTIDRGLIKFQTNRFWYWKPLDPDTFPVKPTDPIVKWWLYPFDDDISLNDQEWNTLASIDTQTWEIAVVWWWAEGEGANWSSDSSWWSSNWSSSSWSWWSWWWWGGGWWDCEWDQCPREEDEQLLWWFDDVELIVDFATQWRTDVQVWATDAVTKQEYVVFTVGYTSEQLSWDEPITVLHEWWSSYALTDWRNEDFNLWTCLAPTWEECQVYITQQWDIYMPEPYRYTLMWTYAFEGESVIITLRTLAWDDIATVQFIPKSFN